MSLRLDLEDQGKTVLEEGGDTTKNIKKETKERQKEVKAHHSKNTSLSQSQKMHNQKNKYETILSQQEFISKNMEKYKQIFDSNFLTEEEQQQQAANQLKANAGRQSINNFSESQQYVNSQNDQKNTSRKPQFKYNSQGNLSPSRKNEISIIQTSNQVQQSYYQITSNNDLSTTFIPKNIFDDMFTGSSTTPNQQVTTTAIKSKKVSSTKLEPIQQLSYQRENELSDDQMRYKSKNAQQLLAQQKKLQLKNIKLNQDISYFKEQKEQKVSALIDAQTITNTYIMKNPASLFHASSEQKKSNMYTQMFEHSHNKEKFDTNLASIQHKIISEELRKSMSQQNMSHNVSNIMSQTGARILLDSKKPSQHNLTQNGVNFSNNSSDQKNIFQKRASLDVNTTRQVSQIGVNQNNSIIQNGQASSSQQTFRPSKEQLFNRPTNRNEVIELESWLTEMIDKVELSEQMNIKDVFDQIQVIYVACMKELIRQITIQCKDRGRLLQRVWDSYLDLLQKGMQQTQTLKSGEEKEHLEEVTRIHKMYEQTIKLIETELEKKKAQVIEQTKSTEQLTDAIQYLRKKLKSQDVEIKKMQSIEDELRFELEAALQENLKLKLMQGDSKPHDDSNHHTRKNSRQGSLANTGVDPNYQQTMPQDVQSIRSIQNIQVDNTGSKKTSMTTIKIGEKKSKVSVVSHLINFNKKQLVEDEDDEKKRKDLINQFKQSMLERDNLSEDSDVFGKRDDGNLDGRDDELNYLLEEERKMAELNIPDIELYDITETGVQTEDMRFSENQLVNFLIRELSQNSMFADDEPQLIKQYTQSYSIVRQSGLDISQKETVLQALDQCKLQVVSHQKLATINGELAIENTELKSKALDLGIQLKESQQNYQDKKRKWKKRALTYIEQIKEKDEEITKLESDSQKMEEKILQKNKQKQIISKFIGSILKKSRQNQDNPSSQQIEETSQEHIQVVTTEPNEERLDTNGDLIESLEIERQDEHNETDHLHTPQALVRVLSQFVGQDINRENVEQKSREDLNKILLKLGGKGLTSSVKDIDSPMLRGKKAKNSIVNTKSHMSATVKQTKRLYSQNTNTATAILDNILKKKNTIKNAVLPFASIQKFFTTVYQEIMKNDQGYRIPLHISCYDILIQKHGLKRVADEKLGRILKSMFIYKDKSIKMDILSTFLGLNQKFDEIDYYYFLLGLKYFQNINHHVLNLSSEHGHITTDKANEFIQIYFSDKLDSEGFGKLATDIKMSAQQKGIEFEMLLKKCLYYYSEKKEKTKKHIEDIFYATDLDANDQIELYEFDLIFRFIEKKQYDKTLVEEIFFEEADNINISNGEKALSINKFVNLCVQKNLFSEEKCEAFLKQVNEAGIAQNFEQLRDNAEEYKTQIKHRFLKAGKYMSELKQIIKTLFKLVEEPAPSRPNSLWVSYLLMEKESRALLIEHEARSILHNLLPIKLQMLDIIGKRFEEII